MSYHPSWCVYDELRTARLNVKYYTVRVSAAQTINRTTEVLVAITAPGSAVPALFFWDMAVGKVAWGILVGVASIVAAAKPFLKLDERIRLYEKTLTAYRSLEHDLRALQAAIQHDGEYAVNHRTRFEHFLARKRELAENEPIETPRRRLIRRLEYEVNTELPPDSFYIPLASPSEGEPQQ